MIQQFLQFVTAVLLVAIFWELCKINGQLKRSTPRISERGQADDADTKSRATATINKTVGACGRMSGPAPELAFLTFSVHRGRPSLRVPREWRRRRGPRGELRT